MSHRSDYDGRKPEPPYELPCGHEARIAELESHLATVVVALENILRYKPHEGAAMTTKEKQLLDKLILAVEDTEAHWQRCGKCQEESYPCNGLGKFQARRDALRGKLEREP